MRWSPNASRLAAAFMVGAASSLWLFPVIVGPRIQQLRMERDEARVEVESLKGQVEQLKEAERQRQGRPVIKRIAPHLEGDQRVVMEAQRRLQQELKPQIGRPIDNLQPLELFAKLQGSYMEIDGVLYRLELRAVAISAEIALFGEVAPVKPTSQ